ncbi:hypothetical protein BKA70DRAFT_1439839 [Coprinopsis sp. MPI-PUGE-AT-0042]|nr:hypothetical protein BKA70DRAFT_1439839 [Coprinopsis sp. MPI-PUGE-AT-0042]
MDSITLCELLGYKAPAKVNGYPTYDLVPAFMWKDRNRADPHGFMLHAVFPRLRHCVVYSKLSIVSAGEITTKKNNQFNYPGMFTLCATDEFIACLGVLMMHVFSPDTEFPSGGKGDKSGINYYASYTAILCLLQLDNVTRQKILDHWDAEVFPNPFGDGDSSDGQGDEDPELQAAIAAFSRTVAATNVIATDWDTPAFEPEVSVAPARQPLITNGDPTSQVRGSAASAGPLAVPAVHNGHPQRQVSPTITTLPEPEGQAEHRPATPIQDDDVDVPLARPPALAALNISRTGNRSREVTPLASMAINTQGESEEQICAQPKKKAKARSNARGGGPSTSRTTRSRAGASSG